MSTELQPAVARFSSALLTGASLEYLRSVSLEPGFDPNATKPGGYEPILHTAATMGRPDAVDVLIAIGEQRKIQGHALLDLNALDKHGQTPLMKAIIFKNNNVLKRLITAGADVNVAEKSGDTALMHAAAVGDAEVVRALLSAGAIVSVVNSNKRQALHSAVTRGHQEALQILIDAGADVCAKTSACDTALMLAQASLGCVRALLSGGADASIDAQNTTGATALHVAAGIKNIASALYLVNFGADATLLTETGHSAFDLAGEDSSWSRQVRAALAARHARDAIEDVMSIHPNSARSPSP